MQHTTISDKTILMRVDFNVPLKNGNITNDRRIRAALPSIKAALDNGAKLILMSHLGRPDGKGFQAEYSLAPIAKYLSQLLKQQVTLGPTDIINPELNQTVQSMKAGNIILIENLRFHPGETIIDKAAGKREEKLTAEQRKILDDFSMAISNLSNIYINDAFGTSHRKHASMYTVPKLIKAKGGRTIAGFLVRKEIQYLHEALISPSHPFVAILGGAKVSDKIKLISKLLQRVDHILIGGAMAYTLLKAKDIDMGCSRVETDQLTEMKQLLKKAKDKILLPIDHVASNHFDPIAKTAGAPIVVRDQKIPGTLLGLDIGPKTIKSYTNIIKSAKTIVWNGPMGVAELPDYATGTQALAIAIAEATGNGAISVIGGGDSAAAIEKMGLATKMTHISTGGGASMQYLEGSPMPAIDILE